MLKKLTIKNMKLKIIKITILAVLVFSIIVIIVTDIVLIRQLNSKNFGGTFLTNYPTLATASSTSYALTTTSTRLLATTTGNNRIAAFFSVYGCTTLVAPVLHLNTSSDAPATSSTGPITTGTSTIKMNAYDDAPLTNTAVQGLIESGTCTVIVTEWRAFR